jgi:predicted nucleotidyltransferase
MSVINLQKEMLVKVATALGDDLIKAMVFVGGCTTGLLVTDEFTKEQIRYTDDVDLIVDIIGYAAWTDLQEQLKVKGFSIDMGEEVMCRMILDNLKVDFMPVDDKALGFTNIWYKDAVATAQDYVLNDALTIKLITPEYFVATKLEAYLGRGNGDALSSHDIEDLLNIFDGRASIVDDILSASEDLQNYVSEQLSSLMADGNFEYAVQGTARNDPGREQLIFDRLEGCIAND